MEKIKQKTDGGISKAPLGIKISVSLVCAALALLLGRVKIFFGAVPLGIAFAASLTKCAPFAIAALIIDRLVTASDYAYVFAYALCTVIRVLSSVTAGAVRARKEARHFTLGVLYSSLFEESVGMRVASASFAAFLAGLYKLVAGGFLYYDLFGTLVCVGASALSCLWWCYLPSVREREGEWSFSYFLRLSGAAALAAAATVGARSMQLYGVVLSVFLAIFISLFTSRIRGVASGALVASACGVCVSVKYAPLFVFGTISYGFVSHISLLAAAIVSFASALAWSLYIGGIGALQGYVSSSFAATFLFYSVDKLYISPTLKTNDADKDPTDADKTDTVQREARERNVPARLLLDLIRRRNAGIAAALASLEDDMEEIRQSDAWGDRHIGSVLKKLRVSRTGMRAEIGAVDGGGDWETDEFLRSEFDHLKKREQLGSTCGINYRAICERLADTSFLTDAYEENPAFSEFLDRELSELAPFSVFEDARKSIIAVLCKGDALSSNMSSVRKALISAGAGDLADGELVHSDDGDYATFAARSAMTIEAMGQRMSRNGGTRVCGDCFGISRSKNDNYLCAYVSDGMGSGERASVISKICTTFLERLLPVSDEGFSEEFILTLADAYIKGENVGSERECCTTLDLVCIDSRNMRARFYKSGAAPTYVFRDGTLFKVRSRSRPLGIVKDFECEMSEMAIVPQDVIIMVSDGVTGGREESPELFELLRRRLLTHSAQQLCEAVIDFALTQKNDDDVSAIVIKVGERSIYELNRGI